MQQHHRLEHLTFSFKVSSHCICGTIASKLSNPTRPTRDSVLVKVSALFHNAMDWLPTVIFKTLPQRIIHSSGVNMWTGKTRLNHLDLLEFSVRLIDSNQWVHTLAVISQFLRGTFRHLLAKLPAHQCSNTDIPCKSVYNHHILGQYDKINLTVLEPRPMINNLSCTLRCPRCLIQTLWILWSYFQIVLFHCKLL